VAHEDEGLSKVKARPAEKRDADVWLRMRRDLWPEGGEAEHREEIAQYFRGDFPRAPWAVLLAEDRRGRALGFVELSIRPYAEGCRSSRVAYLEGWYVVSEARGRGVGRALAAAAEAWGRAQGCTELASDADPENTASVVVHRALGFEDMGLIRCFRKNL